MSTVQNNQASWTNLAEQQLDSKYEKCRNITEEIYKRINITFQIKKLETGEQSDISDNSDHIDSNELSNETDLFACDKSDISSSTDAEHTKNVPCAAPAFNNNNNNNEERNKAALYKKPRKRFRKRVKKRPPNRKRSDSEGSSDEAPLSRSVLILSSDLKPKLSIEKEAPKKSTLPSKNLTLKELLKPTDYKLPTVLIEKIKSIDKEAVTKSDIDKKSETNSTAIDNKYVEKSLGEGKKEIKYDIAVDRGRKMLCPESETRSKDVKVTEWKNCSLCSLSFRGERGLRRHMSMSHITIPEGNK